MQERRPRSIALPPHRRTYAQHSKYQRHYSPEIAPWLLCATPRDGYQEGSARRDEQKAAEPIDLHQFVPEGRLW